MTILDAVTNLDRRTVRPIHCPPAKTTEWEYPVEGSECDGSNLFTTMED